MLHIVPKIDSIYDLKSILEENPKVELKFTKKDGSIRYMNCTRKPDVIPSKEQKEITEGVKVKDQLEILNQIRVYDIDCNGWRTVNFDTVEWVNFKDENSLLHAFQVVFKKIEPEVSVPPHTF